MKSTRTVVKVGSGVVTADTGRLEIDRNSLYRIAAEIHEAMAAGDQVILVSSGAIAMGLEELDLQQKPSELPKVQALAAIGQSQLMRLWREAFGHHGRRVGQVLLTHDDLEDRTRFNNVRATLDSLLGYGVVPVINENDTVATDEITVGDNDNLACHVARMMGVDSLVLLTTVDGLLDDHGAVVPVVTADDDPQTLVKDTAGGVGRGGMASKLAAATAAAKGGIEVRIANGRRPGGVSGTGGTRFEPADCGLSARKHWIAHVLKSRGVIRLDAGAANAVRNNGASLLPVGITAVEGDFMAGEAVTLCDPAGVEFARGLARRSADQVLAERGTRGSGPAVHRDDLVMLEGDA